jgi:signal peptide peptidase SppA
VRTGVAVVPVSVPNFRYANLFTQISGATSLEVLATDIQQAADDPRIKQILLNIDSPGGQATGIAELAEMIRAIDKPVTAYVDGAAASAAYWLASAADRIVMSKTAMVGSIGAVVSLSTAKDKDSVEIVSSQSPNKRPDASTDAGRAQIQALIDSLAAVFVADVAAYRQVDESTVMDKFGQGAVFVGQEAVDRGMADEIGTFETLIESLTAGLTGSTSGGYMPKTEGIPAAEKPEIDRAWLAANNPQIVKSIHDEAFAAGANAERDRIQSVEAQALPGHEALIAQLKFDGKTTGPEAAVAVLQAEKTLAADRAKALEAEAPEPISFAAEGEGDTAPAKGSAAAFDDAVANQVAQGKTRGQAITAAAKSDPQAHAAWIAKMNGGK